MGFDPEAPAFDLTAIREKLANTTGRTYWRSLEEVAETPEFRDFLEAEFPAAAESIATSLDRRQFLKLMGASLAMAGLGACTKQPLEKILPYAKQPEELVPGNPIFFATAYPLGGGAAPILVESHMGRPTKIEGNPEHPASLGATSAMTQASVLDLYDPDRSQVLLRAGEIRPWADFATAVADVMTKLGPIKGRGLRILSEPLVSPTLAAAIGKLLADLPEARWHQWEPLGRESVREGARLAFDRIVEPRYDFAKADVILSLESDFLFDGPGQVRYARDFSARRKASSPSASLNRLYVVESAPSVTGSKADHRLALRASEISGFARALAAELGINLDKPAGLAGRAGWVSAVAKDLLANKGRALVLAGPSQPADVHSLCHAINERLANAGQTVVYTMPVEESAPTPKDGLDTLAADMAGGKVSALFILGVNPVYSAAVDLEFTAALTKVPFTAHLSQQQDETSLRTLWHIPATHYLESWGDARAYDGTVTIQQPLIEPLYQGKSALEVISLLRGTSTGSDYDRVRDYWKSAVSVPDFEVFWRRSVHDGFIAGSERPALDIAVRPDFFVYLAQLPATDRDAGELEVVFRADPTIHDGRFANNGWLQETPKPWTRLTWDNAAMISPALAEKRKLSDGDVVELQVGNRKITAPVWTTPGQPEQTVTLHLGYGRTRAGHVGTGVGFSAYALRTVKNQWIASGVKMRATGVHYPLATTQTHHNMEGRELFRTADIATYAARPNFAQEPDNREMVEGHPEHEVPSMYPDWKYEGNAWGMTIDLSACIGCNACLVACQSENNIAVVGKEQVLRGREMHWIRIDRYFEGDLDNPAVYNQPIPCMQCEKAPCEVVCPVNATNHSSEGLNDMTYNRCVGTRYCANNCPYKVRRFNFYLFQDWDTESLKGQRNPDVTVRSRGVMEKCNYCVQRISSARIKSRKEDRDVRDGEVVTACQQACPSDAIVFGNINDKRSRVAATKADPRNYALLAELGTKPRTTYLAAITNPNPELVADAKATNQAAEKGGQL